MAEIASIVNISKAIWSKKRAASSGANKRNGAQIYPHI